MNKPLVSVVIPCFNQGQYLDECISSVRKQTYKNIEVIIVDDGSTDEFTITKLESLKKVNDLQIISKTNGGLSSARNIGIKGSMGELVLPLDCDDMIAESYIEKAVDVFESNTKVGIVYCRGKYFGAIDKLMDSHYSTLKNQLLYNSLFCSGLFYRKDFDIINGYDESMKTGFEDWDLWNRLIYLGLQVYQIPEVLFFYRQKDKSMLKILNANKEFKVIAENYLFKKNIHIYEKEFGSILQVFREYEWLKKQSLSLDLARNEIKKTMSYKLGNFILYPFKMLRSLIKK